MPRGDDEAIVARCGPLPGFGDALLGERLLVGLFAGRRFFGELLTDEFLVAGRTFLE